MNLCLPACRTYNVHDFALTRTHLALCFGLSAAVVMLCPGTAPEANPEGFFLAMNHKVQVFHSLTTPRDIFMDQFAPFSHPSISEPTNPLLGRCQQVASSVSPWVILLLSEKFNTSHPLRDASW